MNFIRQKLCEKWNVHLHRAFSSGNFRDERAAGKFSLQLDDSRGYLLPESTVVFYKEHGRAAGEEQILELHAGKDIDIIQRLIPYKEMGGFAEGFCQKYFFLLTLAVSFNLLLKLRAFQPELCQHGAKERAVQPVF